MSFQDIGPPPRLRRNHPPKLPTVRATPISTSESGKISKQNKPNTARGRSIRQKIDNIVLPDVSRVELSSVTSSVSSNVSLDRLKLAETTSDDPGALRERQQINFIQESLTRKSAFAKLTNETLQFQRLVADLEMVLKSAGETPKAAWRARILVQSAQDTDKGLWGKLCDYKDSLLLNKTNEHELRTAQTACRKLHRDFKRSHNALITLLTLYETRQKAEASQLGAMNWSGPQHEDYFDRVMRQRELERMNESMRQVNEIYHGLACLVDGQQENINRLEEHIDFANANVEAGANEIECFSKRDLFMCGAMDDGCGSDDNSTFGRPVSFTDDKHLDGVRVSENFYWSMPFETLKEDMTSVQNDILLLGKSIVSKSKNLECNNLK